MRALLCKHYGSVEDLVLEETPDPIPGAGEVVLDVRAAGINFPDLLIVAGKYQEKPALPFIPGGECSGVVSALGEGVEGLHVGAPVIAMSTIGAFAEKIAVPAVSTLPLPAGMSFETAAGVSIAYGTSYYALKERAGLASGETLLVLGAAGGVGMAAVELGKKMGARVIAAASTDEKLAIAREAGADEGINYSSRPLKQAVKELTHGKGADVVYDPVGGDYSEQAFRAIAWKGRHLVVGFASGGIPSLPLNLTLLKGAQVVGVFWGSWTAREPAASLRNFAELQAMFEGGELQPRITGYPLENFARAFASLAERRATGKVVLTVAPPS